MNIRHPRIVSVILGTLWAVFSGFPAAADDTELFLYNNFDSPANPNILFVIDNSGSMGSHVSTQPNYVSSTTYPSAGCDVNRIYWRRNTGAAPDCNSDNWFDASALRCGNATTALAASGFFTDNMAQYDPSTGSGGRRWEDISADQKTRVVECEDDEGEHGDGTDATNLWPRNGSTNASGYWGDDTTKISWGQNPVNDTYTLFTGNFLNWSQSLTSEQTRLEIIQDVTNDLLSSVNGINVGLMYFNMNTSEDNSGGQIAAAIADLGRTRQGTQTTIQSITPSGFTPLSESMYEAAMYYSGRELVYGDNSVGTSIINGTNPRRYITPIEYGCQKNYIVLLTDGEPTNDSDADNLIMDAVDDSGASFAERVADNEITGAPGSGVCDAEGDTYPPGVNPSGGDCLDDLAEFLYDGDWSNLPDQQNITTHTVGFQIDLPILAKTAERGGGEYYTAHDTATLTTALTNIITMVLEKDISFTAPTVAVNSFNRTQTLSDLFISVFRPSGTAHWPGNLKKYRLDPRTAEIVDANGDAAVNLSNGFFKDTAQSFWSPAVDGLDTEAGGAANLIPSSPSFVATTPPTPPRRVFTRLDLTGEDLTSAANTISEDNMLLTDALLNTGATADDPTREEVIGFMNGIDTPDVDGNDETLEARRQMGDPFHSQPASVLYGPGLREGLVFVGTNDGYLHAINLETGVEEWAFIPPEFLGMQVDLFLNDPVTAKSYGIDGDIRVQIVADEDGVIEPLEGEKVYLFFGMGRGGDFYYGLDVTDRDSPRLLWKLDNSTLTGLGQTWSAPMPTRMNVGGSVTQNAEKLVLVFGGGYEADQDNSALTTDSVGNNIYIVDSVSGSLLWHGGLSGRDKSFNTPGRAMSYSIPSRIRVVDVDGDGYTDRMYAGDMGGQVWRFDVTNGEPAATLVNGGVIASLGGAATPGAPEHTRRFYNAPDVAFINSPTGNFIHVGIGSGHRGHPLDLVTQDYFYALRDYATGALTQAQYNARTIVGHADLTLVNVTNNVPANGPGWRMALDVGGWQGEKVLAEARTFANKVIFSTFMPTVTTVDACMPQLGTNRTYAVSVFNAAPVLNLDGSADGDPLTSSDLFVEASGGILPVAQALFLDNDTDGDGLPDIEDERPDTMDGDSNDNGIPDGEEDWDSDGVVNDLDDDDDNDGIPDSEETSGGIVCVGLRCFTGVLTNDPVRGTWTQESLD
jgi:type IV pilus assembly protein PilY1